MKQNERLLVYAVTGFLALILVVAVVFGDGPKAPVTGEERGGTSLSDILGGGEKAQAQQGDPAGTRADGPEAGGVSGSTTAFEGPVAAKVEQPLRAPAPSAASLVQQKLGSYRRDRSVRFVTAKRGDTFSHLAKRWCGKVDGVVQEIEYLNETTVSTRLREGEQVGVPWVDDEVLLAILEAEAVPTRLAGGSAATGVSQPAVGVPGPAGPSYATPAITAMGDAGVQPASATVSSAGAASAFTLYTIKGGDTLWPILAKRFGNRKVPAMIERVKALNPGLDVDRLRVGKTIKLPASAE